MAIFVDCESLDSNLLLVVKKFVLARFVRESRCGIPALRQLVTKQFLVC